MPQPKLYWDLAASLSGLMTAQRQSRRVSLIRQVVRLAPRSPTKRCGQSIVEKGQGTKSLPRYMCGAVQVPGERVSRPSDHP